MPTYELVVISRLCGRADATNIVKRIANSIWERKGIIRDIEFMGALQLPVKMFRADGSHWKGMYWLFRTNIPIPALADFHDELERDVDLIKHFHSLSPDEETIVKKVECFLEEESLPPAYRTDVYDLMTKGKFPIKSRKL